MMAEVFHALTVKASPPVFSSIQILTLMHLRLLVEYKK